MSMTWGRPLFLVPESAAFSAICWGLCRATPPWMCPGIDRSLALETTG